MITRLVLFLLLTFFSATGFTQEKIKGDRNVVINETLIATYNKLLLSEKFDIVLAESDTPKIEIEADENLHDVIRFEVVDSVLSFRTTSKIVSSKRLNINVYFTKALKEIELRESAEISAMDKIENDHLTLKTRDNSRAYLNIRSSNFNFESSGKSKSRLNIESTKTYLDLNDSSNLEALIVSDTLSTIMYMHSRANIEGSTKYLDLKTLASSDFTGKNLTTETCNLSTEDTSDAIINVNEHLNVKATGNSDIDFYGNAKIDLETFSGTVTLQKKEL